MLANGRWEMIKIWLKVSNKKGQEADDMEEEDVKNSGKFFYVFYGLGLFSLLFTTTYLRPVQVFFIQILPTQKFDKIWTISG